MLRTLFALRALFGLRRYLFHVIGSLANYLIGTFNTHHIMKQLLTTILFTLMTLATAHSQENLSYQLPPQSILKLADYQRPPSVTMDTRKTYMLLSYRPTYKSLDDLNQQEISLAGLRVNPATNISSSMSYVSSLKMRKLTDKEPVEFAGLPQNMRIANVVWSPDETKVAFTNTVANGVELWIVDMLTAKATKLTDAVLNVNVGNPVNWFRDSKSLLVRMLPSKRDALIDVKKALPAGPIISVSDGSKSQNRTYQDMLKNPTDEANFVTLTTSELYKVQLDGSKKLFKDADLYVNEIISPDGN
ncbi:S9 family peptidase, partial [bacterium]|nr:S9 family peptidase [bacterium]